MYVYRRRLEERRLAVEEVSRAPRVPYCAMLYHITAYYIMLQYSMLHYTILCYISYIYIYTYTIFIDDVYHYCVYDFYIIYTSITLLYYTLHYVILHYSIFYYIISLAARDSFGASPGRSPTTVRRHYYQYYYQYDYHYYLYYDYKYYYQQQQQQKYCYYQSRNRRPAAGSYSRPGAECWIDSDCDTSKCLLTKLRNAYVLNASLPQTLSVAPARFAGQVCHECV